MFGSVSGGYMERLQTIWDVGKNSKILLTISMMCADLMRLGEEIYSLEEGGADLLHFDIVDGHFAPNMHLGIDIIRAARRVSKLPFDAHLMVINPESLLERLADAGVQLVVVHPEGCEDILQVIDRIHSYGMRAGVALSPNDPPSLLDEVKPLIDLVLIMTIKPGLGGQPLIPAMIPKIGQVRRQLGSDRDRIIIGVDGRVSRETGPRMVQQGARFLVCGSSSIFGSSMDTKDAVLAFRRDLEAGIDALLPTLKGSA